MWWSLVGWLDRGRGLFPESTTMRGAPQMRFPEASAVSPSLPVTGEVEECGCLCPAACWSHQVCVGTRASLSVLMKLLGASLGCAACVGPSCPVSNRAPGGGAGARVGQFSLTPWRGRGPALASALLGSLCRTVPATRWPQWSGHGAQGGPHQRLCSLPGLWIPGDSGSSLGPANFLGFLVEEWKTK